MDLQGVSAKGAGKCWTGYLAPLTGVVASLRWTGGVPLSPQAVVKPSEEGATSAGGESGSSFGARGSLG